MDRIFDLADFEANPGKYELFQTAQIASADLIGFIRGEFVALEYVCNADEPCLQKAIVPVYRLVSRNGDVTDVYANALMNFTL